MNEEIKERADFLFEIIKRYDQQLASTNFKVGLLLSFLVAVIVGLTLRLTSFSVVFANATSAYFVMLTAVYGTIVFAVIAIYHLIRAVTPNASTPKHRTSLLFFGDVAKHETGEDYYRSLSNCSSNSLVKDLACQTHTLAGIVSEKFRLIKLASTIIKLGVLPLMAVSVILVTLINT